MGTNKRQRAVREYAAQHGLSYTKAMRALDKDREASAAVTLPSDPHSGYAVVFTTEHDTPQEWEHAFVTALRPFAGTPEYAMPRPRLVIVGTMPAWSAELGPDMDAENTTHLTGHNDGVALVNQIVAARLENPGEETEPLAVILPRHGAPLPSGTAAAWARQARQVRMSIIGFEDDRRTNIPVILTNGQVVNLLDKTTLTGVDGTATVRHHDLVHVVDTFLRHQFEDGYHAERRVLIVTREGLDLHRLPKHPSVRVVGPEDLAQEQDRMSRARRALAQKGDGSTDGEAYTWEHLAPAERKALGVQPTLILVDGRLTDPRLRATLEAIGRAGRSAGVFAYLFDDAPRIPMTPDRQARIEGFRDIPAALSAFLHDGDGRGTVTVITDAPHAGLPAWAKGLPQVRVLSSAEASNRFQEGTLGDGVDPRDRPALFIGGTMTQDGEDLMDALDRVGRSRGVSTARASAAAPLTPLGHPRHLTRMVYQDADGVDRALEFNPCDNVLLAGVVGSGATVLSLPVMAHLVDAGYRVCRVDPRHPDEYPHVPGVTYTPKGESEAMEAIAAMEPGTADRPAALVLDHAYALLFGLRHSRNGQRASEQNLHRLMLDPHTAVIVRDENPSEVAAPWPGFHALLGVRVLMGKAPGIMRRVVLGDVPEVPVPEGRGAGVMLSRVGADPQVIFPREVSLG